MLRRFTKKRFAAALSVVAVLAIAGAALAYFTDSGTGTGNATVGSSASYTVTQTGTSGTVYPGSGTSTLSFSITNNGQGQQKVSTVKDASVKADANGDAVHGNTSIVGCKAAWFHVDGSSVATATLAHGESTTGSATISMPANSTDNQDACQGATPDVSYQIG